MAAMHFTVPVVIDLFVKVAVNRFVNAAIGGFLGLGERFQ
jgi:hypothetical protein